MRRIVKLAASAWLITVVPADAEGLGRATKWNVDRAAHLLRRAGFGGSAADVQRLAALGLDRAVDSLVDFEASPQTHPDYALSALPDVFDARPVLDALSGDQRDEVRQQLRVLNQARLEELRAWWAQRMALTPRPFEEKMTLFWHGHFTTGAEEVKLTRLIAEQHRMLRRYAAGSFRTLLSAVCRDRAMLKYLDSDSNKKAQPNENFARELLELFTLGEGNYTEEDIKEAARAFTGWSVSPEGFKFRPRQHDSSPKTFLGRTGDFDGADILSIILEQPAAAEYVARRMLRFFATEHPPEELVQAVALQFRDSDYNIRETLRALFKSEIFYQPGIPFEHIKSPPELVVGAARALAMTEVDGYCLAQAVRSMGQDLFQPPNVKGWDGGRTWINSATLFTRYEFAARILQGTPEGAFDRRARKLEELEHVAAELRAVFGEDVEFLRMAPQVENIRQERFDPRGLLSPKERWTHGEIVTYCTDLLLQRKLGETCRRQLLERFGPENAVFTYEPEMADRKLRDLLREIMILPEFQAS